MWSQRTGTQDVGPWKFPPFRHAPPVTPSVPAPHWAQVYTQMWKLREVQTGTETYLSPKGVPKPPKETGARTGKGPGWSPGKQADSAPLPAPLPGSGPQVGRGDSA